MPENNNQNATDNKTKQGTPTVTGDMIPIGFGLEGYQVKNTGQESTAAECGIGGVYAGGGTSVGWTDYGQLDEDRWVPDKELKQVVVQTTCFQSVPLKNTTSGKVVYHNLADKVDVYDFLGGCAFGTSIGGGLDPSLTMIDKWIALTKGGDFSAGCGISPHTLAHYLNHFYGLHETYSTVVPMLKTGKVNAEIVYNTGDGQGKAFRIKVVESAGSSAGYKGVPNNCKGQIIVYDIFDTMVAVLMTKGFEDVMKWRHSVKGEINTGQIDFPWKDVTYDYKTGTIPGYGPQKVKEMLSNAECKFGSMDIGIVASARWTSKTNNGHGLPIARVRFFCDPEDYAVCKAKLPTLPEEFTKCNYENGAVQVDGGMGGDFDPSKYDSAGAAIWAAADRISNFMNCLGEFTDFKTSRDRFRYVQISNAASPTIKSSSWPFNWQPNNSASQRLDICCGSFVFWVLGESGVTKKQAISNIKGKMSNCDVDVIQAALSSDYKAVDVGKDPKQAQKGDIVIYGLGGASHGGIVDSFNGNKIVEFGAGGGSIKNPSGNPRSYFQNSGSTRDTNKPTWGTSNIAHIIRIVKA